MATLASVLAALEAAVVSAVGSTRLASDLRDDLEKIPDGALRHQITGTPVGYAGASNTRQQVAGFVVTLKRKLSAGEAERTWTEGALLPHLATLTDLAWWEALAGVHSVAADAAKLAVEVRRDAGLVSASVQITGVSLDG